MPGSVLACGGLIPSGGAFSSSEPEGSGFSPSASTPGEPCADSSPFGVLSVSDSSGKLPPFPESTDSTASDSRTTER